MILPFLYPWLDSLSVYVRTIYAVNFWTLCISSNIIVSELFRLNLIDESKVTDKDYISSLLKQHSQNVLENMKIHISVHDQFRDSMLEELDKGNTETAIVLAGVCVEHMLNLFYRNVLPIKYSMSDKDVGIAIERLRIPDKIGWFYNMTTNSNIDQDLYHFILNLNSIRNKIVHYQAIPEILDDDLTGSYNEINRKIKNITISKIDEYIEELQVQLMSTLNAKMPELVRAQEIIKSLGFFREDDDFA